MVQTSVPTLLQHGHDTVNEGTAEGVKRNLVEPLDPELAAKFQYEPPYRKPYPRVLGAIRRNIFITYVVVVALASIGWLVTDFWYTVVLAARFDAWWNRAKIISVPLICLGFTWFHVWLALQMMFYPINFIGICKPYIGWQGIVPRKAGVMAQRACDAMIGNIVSIEEFMDRIDPEEFFSSLQSTLSVIASEVLEQVVQKRWPTMWEALPNSVQLEIKEKVLEDVKKSLMPAMADLKQNINTILDIKQMSIDALVANPRMMVEMFREIAPRELLFIQHVAAVMGFLLGLVQTVLYVCITGKYADYYILPISGLIIGFFTNWLALWMTFRPIWPHMMCGNMLNWQGVFLKRQKEAAAKMSHLICKKVIDARAMIEYMLKSSDTGVEQLLAIYQKHMTATIESSVGFARTVVPTFVGQGIDDLKKDVVDISLEILPKHTREIEAFVDTAMNVEETLSWRLARVPPPEFEDIVHPIFKDDEWILLLVGGVLGVIVGLVQAWCMQNL